MYKVVSYKDKPAVIISQSNDDLPTYVATVMYMVEEDGVVHAAMDRIYDRSLISDYSCPYADEIDPARMHCVDGKCKYILESPARLSFMCSSCLATSMRLEIIGVN